MTATIETAAPGGRAGVSVADGAAGGGGRSGARWPSRDKDSTKRKASSSLPLSTTSAGKVSTERMLPSPSLICRTRGACGFSLSPCVSGSSHTTLTASSLPEAADNAWEVRPNDATPVRTAVGTDAVEVICGAGSGKRTGIIPPCELSATALDCCARPCRRAETIETNAGSVGRGNSSPSLSAGVTPRVSLATALVGEVAFDAVQFVKFLLGRRVPVGGFWASPPKRNSAMHRACRAAATSDSERGPLTLTLQRNGFDVMLPS